MKRRSQLSAYINYGVEIIVREIPVKQFANPVAFSQPALADIRPGVVEMGRQLSS
jgi:hypothetical protein